MCLQTITDILRHDAPANWQPTGRDAGAYLDLAEHIVAAAIAWQDEQGRIIDPFLGEAYTTGTARFVGALGGLIGAGRGLAWRDQLDRAYARCCAEMSQPKATGADFITRELAWAAHRVGDLPPIPRLDPESLYHDTLSNGRPIVHNWNIYALVGEYLKVQWQLGGDPRGLDFVQRYLPLQFQHFTRHGMYRDPGSPMTYDLTVRQNLSLLLDAGYTGAHRDRIDRLLRDAGLTMLLTVSPHGLAPYGGRSNQFHMMEAMIACIGEFEARRWARLDRPDLAGAFKRLARRAVAATETWLRLEPMRHTKNCFPPALRHRDDEPGLYSVYSLLAASLLTVAHELADDAIPERAMPAEIGGYVLHLDDEFACVFANAGGYQLQIGTRADLRHEGTGLGRIQREPCDPLLALHTPTAAVIGPVWRFDETCDWQSLAAQSASIARIELRPHHVAVDRASFTLVWQGDFPQVCQTYTLSREGVEIEAALPESDHLRLGFAVPLLQTDGQRQPRVQTTEDGWRLQLEGQRYRVQCLSPSPVRVTLPPETVSNRNGRYRLGVFIAPRDEKRMHVRLALEDATGQG